MLNTMPENADKNSELIEAWWRAGPLKIDEI